MICWCRLISQGRILGRKNDLYKAAYNLILAWNYLLAIILECSGIVLVQARRNTASCNIE